MKLNIRQSYLVAYQLLHRIYNEVEKDDADDIYGSLVSGFNPYIYTDETSGDPAAWEDWKNVLNKITRNNCLDLQEVLDATYAFIKFHQDEFGFKLAHILEKIKTITTESAKFILCLNWVLNPETAHNSILENGGYSIIGNIKPETAQILLNDNPYSMCGARVIERNENDNGSFIIRIPLKQNGSPDKNIDTISFEHSGYKIKKIYLSDTNVAVRYFGFYVGAIELESE